MCHAPDNTAAKRRKIPAKTNIPFKRFYDQKFMFSCEFYRKTFRQLHPADPDTVSIATTAKINNNEILKLVGDLKVS